MHRHARGGGWRDSSKQTPLSGSPFVPSVATLEIRSVQIRGIRGSYSAL